MYTRKQTSIGNGIIIEVNMDSPRFCCCSSFWFSLSSCILKVANFCWIAHSWLDLRFSLTFIYRSNWNLRQPNTIIFHPYSWHHLGKLKIGHQDLANSYRLPMSQDHHGHIAFILVIIPCFSPRSWRSFTIIYDRILNIWNTTGCISGAEDACRSGRSELILIYSSFSCYSIFNFLSSVFVFYLN